MLRNLYIINGKQDSSPFCRQPFYMVYPPYFYKKILILKILIFYNFPKISTPINLTILKVEHLPKVTETAYSCNLVDEKVNRKSHSKWALPLCWEGFAKFMFICYVRAFALHIVKFMFYGKHPKKFASDG